MGLAYSILIFNKPSTDRCRSMFKRLITISVSLLLLLLSAGSHAEEMKVPPTVVEAAKVRSQNWQQHVAATGTLLANQGTVLRAEVGGRITSIYFQPGQTIAEGAPLIDINPAIVEGEFKAKQAELKLNQANYQRAAQLFQRKLFPKAELDKQLALLNTAKADLASAQAKLAQARVKAPFAGKVGLNKFNVGDYVAVGQELVSIQSLDPLRVDFSVPEIYANQLAIGQAVTITVASAPGNTFQGKLIGIDTMIDPKTRSIAVRAHIPNKDQKLLPGAFAQITLFMGQSQPVLTLPQQAVVYEDGKTFVFKVVADKAIKVLVKAGKRIGSDIVIEQGVNANEQVVTAGQLKLMDQAPVVVKP